jgi:hypothetical protein
MPRRAGFISIEEAREALPDIEDFVAQLCVAKHVDSSGSTWLRQDDVESLSRVFTGNRVTSGRQRRITSN